MNLLTKSFLFLISITNFAYAQDCKARVLIETDMENARLIVNDIVQEQSKNFILELEPGKYSLKIVENFSKWNSVIIEDTLTVNDCDDINLNYSLSKKILLDSNPQNVYVFESDSLIGFTPLFIDDNFESLILRKPGYEEREISRQEAASGFKPELKFTGRIKGESFYESFLFKVLIGAAIALGATTAYYKLEADKKFDEYQNTGDPAALQQTDKYDLISGIAFVALQIDFGLILYMFLTD